MAKNGVFPKSSTVKIRRLSDNQLQIDFYSIDQHKQLHYQSFLQSELGQFFQAIPFEELVDCLGLKENIKGPDSIFSSKGKIGLMFLKHYTKFSDKKLIEHLNGSYHYQFFCDIIIPPTTSLSNYKIVSTIRCEIAKLYNIESFQQVLSDYWLPYLKDRDSIVMDATCYESHIRYPSDVKLLWESVSYIYKLVKKGSKHLGCPTPRSKYKNWERKYKSYCKLKRKPKKRRRPITRGLLKLLKKLLGILANLLKETPASILSKRQYKRYGAIQQVLEQQWGYFFDGKAITNRIVSIDKPFIRPIVRGKEVKKTEFGAKVHSYQIDGISFIEHLSFDNFHEGIRFQTTVFKAQRQSKRKVKMAGADKIYHTNANRTFVSKHQIKTDFTPKGRKAKDEKQRKKLRQAITKERASRMEGSFGVEKQHYHLDRIRARSEPTEILWICLGIHTANAVKMAKKIQAQKQEIKKAA